MGVATELLVGWHLVGLDVLLALGVHGGEALARVEGLDGGLGEALGERDGGAEAHLQTNKQTKSCIRRGHSG